MNDFNNAMTQQLDAVCDAADALLTILNPEYEHDMELCAAVINAAQATLVDHNKGCCWPYLTDEELRCDEDCMDGKLICGNAKCPLSKSK